MTKNRSKPLFVFSLLFLDAGAFLLALQMAFATRFYWEPFVQMFPATKGVPEMAVYQHSMLVLLPFYLLVFSYLGNYRTTLLSAYDEFIQVSRAVVLCSLLSTAITFAYRGTEYSRLVIGLWSVYSVLFIYALREADKWLFRRLILYVHGPQRVVVIGKGVVLKAIRDMAKHDPFIRPTYLEHTPSAQELTHTIAQHAITSVVLVQGALSGVHILDLSRVCEERNIDCQVVPDLLEIRRGEIIFQGFCGLPTFHIKPLSLHGSNYVLKRSFDLLASSLALAFLAPPLLFVSILIKMDSKGPVLYTQDRMGLRGRKFKLYKFRTMGIDADEQLEKLKHLSERHGPVFKMRNDPRVTRFGAWLRKFSIDEIPQILNVLKGDMSLVGPRPQVLWEAAAYDDHAKKRLRVMPGITGLWQVSGRAALSYEEMINLDIYYLENWSLGLDLKILLRTLPAVFAKQGAY